MDGFNVWQKYLLIKTHFTDELFDATKYNKTSGKYSTFEKRSDRKFFDLLGNRISDNEVKPFFISQFVSNESAYIIDLIDSYEESITTFNQWKGRMSKLSYNFENECRRLCMFMDEHDITFDTLFKTNKKKYPIIMRLMMEGFITLETYILLEKVLTLSTRYDTIYNSDLIYDSYSLKIRKYGMFFNHIDSTRYKNIMKDVFIS